MRQLHAIIASGDRTKALGSRVQVPAAVIHGTRDPLVKPSGGRATAKAIPGARLMMIDGMGHDLPRDLWPTFADAIAPTRGRAPRRRRVAPPGLPRRRGAPPDGVSAAERSRTFTGVSPTRT